MTVAAMSCKTRPGITIDMGLAELYRERSTKMNIFKEFHWR